MHDPPPHAQVLIIGGGISGLSAAATLEQRGIPFLVLEAKNHSGGRMHAIRFGDPAVGQRMIETGANWIQGGSPNPMFQMAKTLGMRTAFERFGDAAGSYDEGYDSQGRLVSHMGRAGILEGPVDACLKQRAQDLAAQVAGTDESVREALNKCGWTVNESSADAGLEFIYFTAEYAVSPLRTSLRHNVPDPQYEWNEPNDYFVVDQNERGFAAVADALTLSPDDPRLVMNAEVAQITSTGTANRVIVTLANGTALEAPAAIVTVPVGVLNAADGGIRFSPPLPKAQARALAKYTMGNFSKVHLQWRETFWRPQVPLPPLTVVRLRLRPHR